MTNTFLDSIKVRRSIYALDKKRFRRGFQN